jgi:thioredoxin reductase (NADPH)
MTTTNGHVASEQASIENVIVIGSGPAGFTAGLYAARANLNPLLITGNDYGGQVSITYDIENYPGFPESLSGPDLVEKMKAQAEKFGTRVEFDYVNEIVVDRHPFVVRTANGAEYRAKSLILCTGARPRYLEMPGEKEYTGKGISYCATCDGFFFRGKDVLVIGGGDSAAEEALFLTRYASRVRILHRRDKFRASKILQDRVFANEKIEVLWNTVPTDHRGGER